MSNVENKNLYNKVQAAKILGINSRTLDKLVANGVVTAITDVYKKPKFRKSYIDKLVVEWNNEK